MRATVLLLLPLLVACAHGTGDDVVETDADDTEAGDTELGDTQVVDTDPVPDTDDTDTDVVDTDTDVADTDSDVADTDVADTDLIDTDPLPDTDDTDPVDTQVIDTGDTDSGLGGDWDGDGFPFWDDCDDGNPLVHPGAPNRCDGGDHSCGTNPIDPEGTATLLDASGVMTDVTLQLTAGAGASPTVARVGPREELRLCGGSWALRLDVDGGKVVGVRDPEIDQGTAAPTLTVGVRGGRVRGVTLTGSLTLGAEVARVGGPALLEDVRVLGRDVGVHLEGTPSFDLKGGEIHGQYSDGLEVVPDPVDGTVVTLSDLTVSDVGYAGLVGAKGATLVLRDVDLARATLGVLADGADLDLERVTLSQVGQPLASGVGGTGRLVDVSWSDATSPASWMGGALLVERGDFRDGVQAWNVETDADVTFADCTFERLDHGNGFGGALLLTAGPGSEVRDSVFRENVGGYGGAIFATSRVRLIGTTFATNHATSGGSLHVLDSAGDDGVHVEGCAFEDNGSDTFGGAVQLELGGTFLDSRFERNLGMTGGGAVHAGSAGASTLTLEGCTFFLNATNGAGGGVLGRTLASAGTTWTGNRATYGGGAHVGSAELDGDTFDGNFAVQAAGAVSWSTGVTGVGVTFGPRANLPTEGAGDGTALGLVSGDFACVAAVCTP